MCRPTNAKVPITTNLTGRKIPLLSNVIIIGMKCMLCTISCVLNSSIGKMMCLNTIEPIISTFIMGGLFALAVLPVTFFAWFLYLPRDSLLFYFMSKEHVISWMLALVSYYVITIIIKDDSHLNVPKASTTKINPKIWKGAQDFMVSHFDYFPMTIVPWTEDAKLDPKRQYVFAGHPHGIHCWPLNAFALEGSPFDLAFPGLCGHTLVGLAATVMFKLPIVRELFLMMRYVDASRHVVNSCMWSGLSIFVCTGGERESMSTKVGEDTVVLSNRKGFVRMALSHGADLVPVFGVGVSDLYATYDLFGDFRRALQQYFKIATIPFHGRWGTPLPYRKPIKLLVGEPIPTPLPKIKGGHVDPKLVDEYHDKYVAALRKMHSTHVKDRVLKIV